ncbi:MAG: DUF5683 domain-containing protein [bacterium]
MKLSQKAITKIFFVFVFIFNTFLFAQTEPKANSNVQSDTTAFEMTKSPWGAVLRSAIVPGWGQYYNESYWKTPLVLSITGYFAYVWVHNNNLYKDYKSLYNTALANNSRFAASYKGKRDFYRDERDLFAFYIGLTYFLNLVDAYVDAQLFDFTVSEDPITSSTMLNIKFYF